jgi:predicted nucleic acid-binding protein
MTSAVLDTNVLISAAIAIAHGQVSTPAQQLFEAAFLRPRNFANVTSAPLLQELEDVLNRGRFALSAPYTSILSHASR